MQLGAVLMDYQTFTSALFWTSSNGIDDAVGTHKWCRDAIPVVSSTRARRLAWCVVGMGDYVGVSTWTAGGLLEV